MVSALEGIYIYISCVVEILYHDVLLCIFDQFVSSDTILVALGWPLGGIFTSYTLDRHKESGLFFFSEAGEPVIKYLLAQHGAGKCGLSFRKG